MRRRKCSLKELLGKITAKNIHAEVDTGDPVGREVW
jgi:antitoxin component of MazEF toxin-antitoxin module